MRVCANCHTPWRGNARQCLCCWQGIALWRECDCGHCHEVTPRWPLVTERQRQTLELIAAWVDRRLPPSTYNGNTLKALERRGYITIGDVVELTDTGREVTRAPSPTPTRRVEPRRARDRSW